MRTRGGFVQEDDRGVGNQLYANGESLALLDGEAAAAGHAHQRVAQRAQLHQLHHLHTCMIPLEKALICLLTIQATLQGQRGRRGEMLN